MSTANEVKNQSRALAREYVELLKDARYRIMDEHSHSFRWLMASLLLLNGSGCLAALGEDKIPLCYKLAASATFLLGVISALLIAYFAQNALRIEISRISSAQAYWTGVLIDGEQDEDREKELAEDFNPNSSKRKRSDRWPRYAGFISTLCFVLAALIAGLGLTDAQMRNLPNQSAFAKGGVAK
jgi:hypothetical protein